MAITSYAELQTAVANWLGRADLTSRVPEFIALCEAKLNRELRAIDQETKNASFSINDEYVNVPSGFLEARLFQVTANGRRFALKQLSLEQQTNRYKDGAGTPESFAVVGGQFRFGPIPDTTYTATLIYYTAIVALATSSPNWVLTNHPDVYLYGSLLEAEGFLQDDNRLPVWKAGYNEGVATLREAHLRKRWGGGALAISPG